MSGFAPRTHKVTLYQGDWQQKFEAADAAARAAEKRWDIARQRAERETRTISSEPSDEQARKEYEALAAERDAIKAQAEAEGAVTITIAARGRKRWAEIVDANPPRTSDDIPEDIRKTDAELGINDQAVSEILTPESIVSIEGSDLSAVDLLDVISSAQFDLLYGVAFAMNRGTGSDPKVASRLTPSPSFDATEKSPSASD